MKQDLASEGILARRERIRRLGFEPDHLTEAEQEELLTIEMLLTGERDRKRALALK